MAPSVYLAGPITGQTYDGAVDWREVASVLLAPDIKAFSPMRGKRYIQEMTDEFGIRSEYPQPLSTAQAITARDRNDVINRDLVLANFTGATRVSIGTVGEIFWADAYRRPVVGILDELHDHAMLRSLIGWFAEDIEEACALVRAILLP